MTSLTATSYSAAAGLTPPWAPALANSVPVLRRLFQRLYLSDLRHYSRVCANRRRLSLELARRFPHLLPRVPRADALLQQCIGGRKVYDACNSGTSQYYTPNGTAVILRSSSRAGTFVFSERQLFRSFGDGWAAFRDQLMPPCKRVQRITSVAAANSYASEHFPHRLRRSAVDGSIFTPSGVAIYAIKHIPAPRRCIFYYNGRGYDCLDPRSSRLLRHVFAAWRQCSSPALPLSVSSPSSPLVVDARDGFTAYPLDDAVYVAPPPETLQSPGSERCDASATHIQAVSRGFLVRRHRRLSRWQAERAFGRGWQLRRLRELMGTDRYAADYPVRLRVVLFCLVRALLPSPAKDQLAVQVINIIYPFVGGSLGRAVECILNYDLCHGAICSALRCLRSAASTGSAAMNACRGVFFASPLSPLCRPVFQGIVSWGEEGGFRAIFGAKQSPDHITQFMVRVDALERAAEDSSPHASAAIWHEPRTAMTVGEEWSSDVIAPLLGLPTDTTVLPNVFAVSTPTPLEPSEPAASAPIAAAAVSPHPTPLPLTPAAAALVAAPPDTGPIDASDDADADPPHRRTRRGRRGGRRSRTQPSESVPEEPPPADLLTAAPGAASPSLSATSAASTSGIGSTTCSVAPAPARLETTTSTPTHMTPGQSSSVSSPPSTSWGDRADEDPQTDYDYPVALPWASSAAPTPPPDLVTSLLDSHGVVHLLGGDVTAAAIVISEWADGLDSPPERSRVAQFLRRTFYPAAALERHMSISAFLDDLNEFAIALSRALRHRGEADPALFSLPVRGRDTGSSASSASPAAGTPLNRPARLHTTNPTTVTQRPRFDMLLASGGTAADPCGPASAAVQAEDMVAARERTAAYLSSKQDRLLSEFRRVSASRRIFAAARTLILHRRIFTSAANSIALHWRLLVRGRRRALPPARTDSSNAPPLSPSTLSSDYAIASLLFECVGHTIGDTRNIALVNSSFCVVWHRPSRLHFEAHVLFVQRQWRLTRFRRRKVWVAVFGEYSDATCVRNDWACTTLLRSVERPGPHQPGDRGPIGVQEFNYYTATIDDVFSMLLNRVAGLSSATHYLVTPDAHHAVSAPVNHRLRFRPETSTPSVAHPAMTLFQVNGCYPLDIGSGPIPEPVYQMGVDYFNGRAWARRHPTPRFTTLCFQIHRITASGPRLPLTLPPPLSMYWAVEEHLQLMGKPFDYVSLWRGPSGALCTPRASTPWAPPSLEAPPLPAPPRLRRVNMSAGRAQIRFHETVARHQRQVLEYRERWVRRNRAALIIQRYFYRFVLTELNLDPATLAAALRIIQTANPYRGHAPMPVGIVQTPQLLAGARCFSSRRNHRLHALHPERVCGCLMRVLQSLSYPLTEWHFRFGAQLAHQAPSLVEIQYKGLSAISRPSESLRAARAAGYATGPRRICLLDYSPQWQFQPTFLSSVGASTGQPLLPLVKIRTGDGYAGSFPYRSHFHLSLRPYSISPHFDPEGSAYLFASDLALGIVDQDIGRMATGSWAGGGGLLGSRRCTGVVSSYGQYSRASSVCRGPPAVTLASCLHVVRDLGTTPDLSASTGLTSSQHAAACRKSALAVPLSEAGGACSDVDLFDACARIVQYRWRCHWARVLDVVWVSRSPPWSHRPIMRLGGSHEINHQLVPVYIINHTASNITLPLNRHRALPEVFTYDYYDHNLMKRSEFVFDVGTETTQETETVFLNYHAGTVADVFNSLRVHTSSSLGPFIRIGGTTLWSSDPIMLATLNGKVLGMNDTLYDVANHADLATIHKLGGIVLEAICISALQQHLNRTCGFPSRIPADSARIIQSRFRYHRARPPSRSAPALPPTPGEGWGVAAGSSQNQNSAAGSSQSLTGTATVVDLHPVNTATIADHRHLLPNLSSIDVRDGFTTHPLDDDDDEDVPGLIDDSVSDDDDDGTPPLIDDSALNSGNETCVECSPPATCEHRWRDWDEQTCYNEHCGGQLLLCTRCHVIRCRECGWRSHLIGALHHKGTPRRV